MITSRSFVQRYALLIYFALAITISWGSILIVAGPEGLPVTPERAESVMALIYMAMLLGPSVAGILMIAVVDGRAGFRDLLSRLLRWRVGARWYGVALLTAPLAAALVLVVLTSISSAFTPEIVLSNDKPALLMSGIIAGLMVAIFEELGWTGFAVPRLRLRHGVFTTGLILGLIWGLWHFPPFWARDSFSEALPLAILLAQLFAWLPPYRVLMVWVYNHTGSLLLVIMMHMSLLASLQILVPAALTGADLLTWLLAWAAVLWVLAAVVVFRRPRHYFNTPPIARQTK